MTIPDTALSLAGFVLAHALWSASDLPAGELLIPLAMVERQGQRELVRFEAASQEAAIRQGKSKMSEVTGTADAWAFARDGVFREGSRTTDAISVDFWAKGMASPVTIVQRYEPFAKRHRFKVVGKALFVVQGSATESSEAKAFLARIHEGLLQHPKVATLWAGWQ